MRCKKCGTENSEEYSFCVECGGILEKTAAFSDIFSDSAKKSTERAFVEEDDVFARGLPEWNLEPPMVVVRRRRK